MSPSPEDLGDRSATSRYVGSWGELMDAVRTGASWSGNERNHCFLNLGGKRFVDASQIAGLNFPDDGRAMAACDWDRDGDLDLWLRNRTAPRLRLMLNGTRGASVAIRLEGVECNRDAIGAGVEIAAEESDAVLRRSVRAGDLFLSQSSKWLHFGLGDRTALDEAIVHWPGGEAEQFAGLEVGGRFLLRQGEGRASRVTLPPVALTASGAVPAAPPEPGVQIRLPVAVPMPELIYRDAAAKPKKLDADGHARLLTIWLSSCEVCLDDLAILERHRVQLAERGVRLLALSADSIETAGTAYEAIESRRFGGEWGFVDAATLGVVLKWQAAMFERQPAEQVPLSLLLDPNGECVAIYRGAMPIERLLRDASELLAIDPQTRWHLAPPLRGTWFTNPVERRFVRQTVGR